MKDYPFPSVLVVLCHTGTHLGLAYLQKDEYEKNVISWSQKAGATKLKRDVAIKFLPRQITASEEEGERFKIEAQAAAALNHPSIATIHAIEEHDDEMFIVMEYIDGKELAHLPKVLNLREVVDYATQIAAGLQAAHGYLVVWGSFIGNTNRPIGQNYLNPRQPSDSRMGFCKGVI